MSHDLKLTAFSILERQSYWNLNATLGLLKPPRPILQGKMLSRFLCKMLDTPARDLFPKQAQAAYGLGDLDKMKSLVGSVLANDPNHGMAVDMLEEVAALSKTGEAKPQP